MWKVEIGDVLSGISPVVHEENINVADVIDQEGLVAGRHHVSGLLVGAITNLNPAIVNNCCFFQ